MLESEIEKILKREIRKAGGEAYKFVSPGNAGVPDRILVLPGGRVIFAELKSSTGKPTRLQSFQINRLTKLGAKVFVIRGLIGLSAFFIHLGMFDAADVVEALLDRGKR